MRRALSVLAAGALAMAAAGVVSVHHASANDFRPCHDNTTAPGHTWTHGDPIKGIPGDPLGSSGYYYLSVKACGPIVEGTVYSPGNWDLDISPDLNSTNELAAAQFHGTGGRVFITNATAGNNYRLRVANISDHVTQKDYAELNSGSRNDGKGDCGGPGPEIDPNTGGAPVDPPPTPGLPVMGCGTAGSAPPPAPPPPPLPPAPAPGPGHTTPPQSRTASAAQTPAPTPKATAKPGAPLALNPGNLSPGGPGSTVLEAGGPNLQSRLDTSGGQLNSRQVATFTGLAWIVVFTALFALRRHPTG